MKRQRFYSKGQIAVVLTLVMAVLLGACALGADVGILYFNWVKLQKAADASAVAGASYLNGEPPTTAVTTAATTAANSYAKDNGIQAAEIVSTDVAADGQSITVNLQRTVPYAFGTLLGLSTGLVSVSATAGLAATNGVKGAIPIGLQCTDSNKISATCTCAGASLQASCNGTYLPYTCQVSGGTCSFPDSTSATNAAAACNANSPGSCAASGTNLSVTGNASPPAYQLHQTFIAGSSGNWADLNLSGGTGGGTSSFTNEIISGYNGAVVSVGDVIFTNTGSVSGPTISAFTTRIGTWLPPNSTPATCLAADSCLSDPQTILIPMVDFSTDPSGKSTPVTITGFTEGYIVGCGGGSGKSGCSGSSMSLLVYFLGQPAPANGTIEANQPCIPGNTAQVQACVPHLID